MLDAKAVGSVIQRFRGKKKISQKLASRLACIGSTHLSAIERGERKPTLEAFGTAASALQGKPSELLAEIEKEIEKTNV